MLSVASGLEVITPSKGLQVFASRTYTVEWEDTSGSRFDIDLYYCGSFCMEDSCGEWVTALCPYGESGCPDNEGDYDIIMPEPMMDTSGDMYKVMVTNSADENDMGCSDEFTLVASAMSPDVGEDGYSLVVTSPSDDDVAMAGEEYTVEWDYDNGVGSKVDRFSIMLYPAGCTGGMVANLCDKPSIGCKDSMGDYDVEIPEDIESGMYSIRVGRFEDDALFGCSDAFTIDGMDMDMSMSMRF